jgi:uncharacterized repeat protein (TIGR02543 family)
MFIVSATAVLPEPASYTLAVEKAGSGTGTVISSPEGISCGENCSKAYNEGTAVTLTVLHSGAIFAGWGGDCSESGTSPTCTLTMDGDKTVTARRTLSIP